MKTSMYPKLVLSALDDNINEHEGKITSKGDLTFMNLIYLVLGGLGVLVEILSFIAIFCKPVFDPNVAKVLLPMGMAFLFMIGLDYCIRGKEHE